MTVTVTGLAITPVKGTRLRSVASVRVDERGVRENRRFYLIDAEDEMVNSLHLGKLHEIVSDYDDRDRRLSLTFPDGRIVEDELRPGEEVMTRFYSQTLPARLVEGDFSEAISQHAGRPLRLVEAGEQSAVDRLAGGAVSLISQASLGRLAHQADRDGVDVRRFRMLIEVDGIGAHEEDRWVGRRLSVGDAVLRGAGHVGRCVITNRDPDTGEITLQTLKILGTYRRNVDTSEPVAFGIYGEVLQPGVVRVGDAVQVDG